MILAQRCKYLETQKNKKRRIRAELHKWSEDNVAVQAALGRQTTFLELFNPYKEFKEKGMPCIHTFPAYSFDLEACIGSLTEHKPFTEVIAHPISGAVTGVTVGEMARRSLNRRSVLKGLLIGAGGGGLVGYLGATKLHHGHSEQLQHMHDNAAYLDEVVNKYG